MAETYAIVETGGKQYRVEEGSSLFVERLPDDEGAKVALRPLMVSSAGKVLATADELGKAKVEAKVTAHVRGPKVRIFKKKPKKGYALRAGHRQALTKLEITSVKTGAAAAKKTTAAKKDTETAAKDEAKPAAAKKPAATKAAADKPAAAAKKPAAKKPAAKKPAAKPETDAPKED